MDTIKSKLVETLSGRGQVHEGETFLCDVTYRLNVYQEIHASRGFGETESVEGLREIKGTISGREVSDLIGKDLLTLHLNDGRYLDFFVINSNGQIAPTGMGTFYRPEIK